MVQYGFYYDNSRCTGCKTCVMACKDYKDSALDVAYRKVYDLEGGTWKSKQTISTPPIACSITFPWRVIIAMIPPA